MPKIEWKGSPLLAPLPPALVTCKYGDEINALAIAWTGIINSQPPKTYISVRPTRHSYAMIKKSGVFAVNLCDKDLCAVTDKCGVFTGAKVNKIEKYGIPVESAKQIDCPIVSTAPLTLECRVTDVIALGSHDMFMADIVAVDVRDDLVDKDGKLRLDKAGLVAFAHGEYFELGKRLGTFGFSVAKKKKQKGR